MKHVTTIIVLLLSMFTSCSEMLLDDEFRGGDYFYLENEGAVMPVWVRGNVASGAFVIFLHGGPGNTAATYAIADSHKELQKDYALVYYDQRGSGAAQGNAKPSSFTIEQFTEDLDKLITLINHKYGNPVIFLAGKSWGGCIGTAYLINPENQYRVRGWIEIDGAHNLKGGIRRSWEWVKTKARERIDAGDDAGRWQKEIDWYDSEPDKINTSYHIRHGKNLNDLNGIYLNPENDPGNGFPWASPIPVFYQLNAVYINNHNAFDIQHIDYTPQVHRIIIPTLILWGRHDGTLPVSLAYEVYDNLGTDPPNKKLFIFENSAHVPSYEEPELYAQVMKEFIEKYK